MHLMLAQSQKQCPSRSRELPQPDRARHPNLLGRRPLHACPGKWSRNAGMYRCVVGRAFCRVMYNRGHQPWTGRETISAIGPFNGGLMAIICRGHDEVGKKAGIASCLAASILTPEGTEHGTADEDVPGPFRHGGNRQ